MVPGTGYREGSNIWSYFAAITVDARAWVAGAAEVSITVPADWDAFWTQINQTDGRDIRVLNAAGDTPLTYDVVDTGGGAFGAADITARSCKIRISGWTPPAAAMCRLVLAWGQASATSGAGSPTTVSPLNGYILVAAPQQGWTALPVRADVTTPAVRVQKTAAEAITYAVSFLPWLRGRLGQYARVSVGTSLSYATYVITNGGSSAGLSGMIDLSKIRFLGADTVVVIAQAGVTATNYMIAVTATTTDSQTIEAAAELVVRTLQEP